MGDDERWLAAVPGAVRARRESLGLTQAEAARRGDVSLPTWGLVESGRQTSFRRASLIGVARALGWPADGIDRLLAGEDPEQLAIRATEDQDVLDRMLLSLFTDAPGEVPDNVQRSVRELLRPYFDDR